MTSPSSQKLSFRSTPVRNKVQKIFLRPAFQRGHSATSDSLVLRGDTLEGWWATGCEGDSSLVGGAQTCVLAAFIPPATSAFQVSKSNYATVYGNNSDTDKSRLRSCNSLSVLGIVTSSHPGSQCIGVSFCHLRNQNSTNSYAKCSSCINNLNYIER